MIITEVPVNLTLPAPEVPRSKGTHVSSIIRCIATETGILKPEWAEEINLIDVREITDPKAILRMSIGLAWEEYYIRKILGKEGIVDHPGELKSDGIYMSPDAESIDVIITDGRKRRRHTIHECKATYKSVKTVGDLSNQFMWLTQCKSYCHGAGTRFAEMHVLFICGDYVFPITPVCKRWAIEFTKDEIEENWQMLVDYRDYRLAKEAENA